MNPRKLTLIDFDTPSMKAFDWGLSAVSIGYGVYAQSPLWIVAGILGAFCAWYRPLSRFQRYMNGFVKGRH